MAFILMAWNMLQFPVLQLHIEILDGDGHAGLCYLIAHTYLGKITIGFIFTPSGS